MRVSCEALTALATGQPISAQPLPAQPATATSER
jgi:hypothetical protein